MRSCRVQVLEARSALDGTAWSLATPFANSYWSVLFSPACFFSRPLAAVGPFLPLQPLQHERSVQRTLTIPSTQPQLYLLREEQAVRKLRQPKGPRSGNCRRVPRSHNLLACSCARYWCCTSFCPWLSLERSCPVSSGSLSKARLVLWLLPCRYNLPIWLSIRRTALLLVTLLSPVQKKTQFLSCVLANSTVELS